MMKRAFTLLELVVVIIILGVLATLGFTQYGRMVERSRGAEARMICADMRKLAYAYRLANGTVNGMPVSALNIGPNSDQIPGPTASACRSSHYFFYNNANNQIDPTVLLYAYRCTSGGKPPQGAVSGGGYACAYENVNLQTGADTWIGSGCVGNEGY